jgi:signal transduction histidine kinase
VRQQLDEVARWMTAQLAPRDGPAPSPAPLPIIAREYVDMLRSALLAQLDAAPVLDGREVVRALRTLEDLSRAWKKTDRGRFISRLTGADSADAVVAIAHDIRSPLTSILILVDSLRRAHSIAGDPIRDRQLGIIHGAARGLSTLADDLIDAARGEQLLVGPAAPFSVAETMAAVADILQPVCEERSLPLHLHPPTVDGRIGHAEALHRILLNLASNALRSTESGFVSIACVELSATTVEFSVVDTGVGIPPHVLETLTDGFTDDGLALRFSRAGLGLAIVRALLSAMDGGLGVETNAGGGTRFFFRLELPPVS